MAFKVIKAKVIAAAMKTKKIGKDDPRRIVHSIKVGLALTLVSLFYYSRLLYDGFGSSGIWAVLTVIVIFEFTVGATLCKGINRGVATTLGGALGIGAKFVTSLFGQKEEEAILLGVLVFLLGQVTIYTCPDVIVIDTDSLHTEVHPHPLAAASTFTRFFPHIKKKYDYGVLIFILTFSLVAVSGYRVDKIVELAHQRLSTIIIGGATCMIISIFVCPVWAGQDLHNLVVLNVEKLANFLEVVAKKMEVVLNMTNHFLKANFAWWEPGHGGFMFRHPWNQYLKIGGLARQCAYQLDALNAYLSSDLQAPTEFQRIIRKPCMKISTESSKALKELASAMKTMMRPSPASTHVRNCKIAIDDLKATMESSSIEREELLQIVPVVTVASTLIEIIKCVEEIAESIYELSEKAHFKSSLKSTVSPEKPHILHRGIVKPVNDGDVDDRCVVITVHGSSNSPENGNLNASKSAQVMV
ncbi:hypothetical protein LguiB_003958 [Lonicera macranthoides]